VAPDDESDDGDSDFESLDFEDEDDSDFSFTSIRKKPHKRTSRVDTRSVDYLEALEQMQFAAAAEASFRDLMSGLSGGASTSAGSSSHNISGLTGLTVPMGFYCVDSDVVPDSEPEGDLLEPWKTPDKGKGKNKRQWQAEYDAGDIHQDAYSVRKETRKRSNLEKQDIRMEEYRLGRRLTYVGLADIFLIDSFYFSYSILTQAEKSTIQLQKHHPELRNAWGDLEAAVGIAKPKKAEQPSGLRVTLLPFQQESLYWMRNQEFDEYAGGLLAVSLAFLLEIILMLTFEFG
jgi:hypothetical protein